MTYVWNRDLDDADPVRDGETPQEIPGALVVNVLAAAEAPWVIVTNGKLWRLYAAAADNKASNYYEVDLEEAAQAQDQQTTMLYHRLFVRFRAESGAGEADCKNKFLQQFMAGQRDLTLGSMPIILGSSKEPALRGFVQQIYPRASQIFYGPAGVVERLADETALALRNAAAHDQALTRANAQSARVGAGDFAIFCTGQTDGASLTTISRASRPALATDSHLTRRGRLAIIQCTMCLTITDFAIFVRRPVPGYNEASCFLDRHDTYVRERPQ